MMVGCTFVTVAVDPLIEPDPEPPPPSVPLTVTRYMSSGPAIVPPARWPSASHWDPPRYPAAEPVSVPDTATLTLTEAEPERLALSCCVPPVAPSVLAICE